MNGSDKQRQRPARRLAVAGMAFEPDADGVLDAVADLEAGDALLLHVGDRALVGALADIGQHPNGPAREQPVGLPGRQLELAGHGLQGGPAPALEGGLGNHGVGQPVAQFGVGIGWIWVIFSAHSGKYRGSPGLPKRSFPLIPPPPPNCPRSRFRGAPPSWKEAIEVQVLVRENNVDQALRVLKKKMQREGIFREMKLRRNYEKPSERRARERAEAIRRTRKLMRKRMEREGY